MLAQESEVAQWITDLPYLAVVVGLAGLVIGAELLVRGAVWVALVLGMSRMAVGLTLVAIGTSLPELLVSLNAARKGEAGMALANVLGSNVSNTLLIVGATAAICAIRLQVRWLELNYMLIATAILGVPFVFGLGIEPIVSWLMLAMLIVFISQLMMRERKNRKANASAEERPAGTAIGWVLHVGLFIGGFYGLQYGANWLVDGAVVIAVDYGMSTELAGLTIVAVGTSLPELATSALAAIRSQPEICIGNILGSNIFNVGAVLGVAGLLQPFAVEPELWRSMAWAAGSAILLVLVLRGSKGVPRLVGIGFVIAFAAFLTIEVLLQPPS